MKKSEAFNRPFQSPSSAHVVIGISRMHQYWISALSEGQGFWAAMDDAGHDTMECYEGLIDQKTGDWKRAVREFIGEDALIMDNVLLINRLELEERFRGKGLARKVVDEVIKTFRSQCAVIACKPFPLQYSGYMSSANESDGKIAR